MDPPTVTAQERKVVVVRRKPIFYKPENVQKAQNEIISPLFHYYNSSKRM